PIAPNRTWHVLLDIISGLNYMHSLDIVHLDLKPANLLVSDDGNLKIADFGLSTKSPTFNDDDRDGDNRYLAPEIYRQQYDKPADIFSLGLIMLEIITNSVLPDRGESYQRLRRGDLSDFLPQFPADSSQLLQSTIASMLNPIPSRRPTAKNILE
ncbi:kinase-like domain-containing protein, partial [Paraphysoderma sedebokerense]